MASQLGYQTIAINKFPNVERRKANQVMKFGQLIECNIETFFLKNHAQNVMEKLFPDAFLKTQN